MPSDRLSFQRALPWVAGGGLLATLVCGLLVPIYTDEVGWRAQLARSPFDGGVDRELADQCGANTTLAAPWFMQPMRHATAWIDAAVADPRAVRVLGVALAGVAVALIVALGRRVDPQHARTGLAVSFALLGLGTTPFLLVWSRPEQPILLALAAAMLIAISASAGPRSAGVRAGAILVLAVFALGSHPKAVVFAPILVAAALLAGRGDDALVVRVAAAVAILLLAGEAFAYWNLRFACPGDPIIAARNAAENVSAAKTGGGWAGLARALAINVSPLGYVAQVQLGSPQMADWLPDTGWAAGRIVAWFVPVRVAWLLALAAILIGLALRVEGSWRTRTRDPMLILAATIAACVLGWSALQTNKNSYESALVLPLLALCLLLVQPMLARRWPRTIGVASGAVVLVALASEAMLLATYAPPLIRTAARPGAIATQPYSFTAWGYPGVRPDILAAGRLCGITPDRARYLLVDDLTYWPFIESWRPMNRTAVLEPWIPTARDPIGFLRAHRSSGMVLQCALLPPALRARAKAQGQFCCIGLLGGTGR